MMASREFVIGDIHGCSRTLKKLLFEVMLIAPGDRLIFVGDYIDKGPRSKKVIKVIMKLMKAGYDVVPLMGNHELMLLGSLKSYEEYMNWFKYGSRSTLLSFHVSHPADIPKKYLDFFESLKYYYETDEYVIVHAGLNFRLKNPLKDKNAMTCMKNKTVHTKKLNGKKLIAGHQPTKINKIRRMADSSDKIILDGGCVLNSSAKGLGSLVAMELKSKEIFVQQCIDFD